LTPRTAERLTVDGPAGPIEVVHNVPAAPLSGVALIAHPHPLQGGTLDNKVVQTLAKTFFALGYAAVRFNFRGVGNSAGTFADGIAFVNRIAKAADARNHHPDIDIRYTKITCMLSTHDAGGITTADLELAEEIEKAAAKS